MALPQVIPVRYSEEDAGYVTFRPVVRQTFSLRELLDMVLSVTGKDPQRIRQILHSGTVVFHFYRYWWDGFDAGEGELRDFLRQFPDADPARPFSAKDCALVLVETANSPAPPPRELTRATMSRKRLFRRRSAWDALLAAASAGPLAYRGYSYAYHADLYRLELTPEASARLALAVASLAPRNLQQESRALAHASSVVFACARGSASS